MSPLTFAMSTAKRNVLRHPDTSFLGNIIWRLSCPSPTATRTTHLWETTSFLSLNSKHDLSYVYCDAYSAQTFSIALTVATHILLRHLAVIIAYQFHNYFLPSFLPSFLRDLLRHLISPNQDDLSYSPRPSFPATKSGELPNNLSLAGERQPVQTSHCGSKIAAVAATWIHEETHLIYGFFTRNPS